MRRELAPDDRDAGTDLEQARARIAR